jgi:hypothetical protein
MVGDADALGLEPVDLEK